MNFSDMIQATKQALSQRDSRRDVLAAKIQTLATEALDAARAKRIDLGDAGTIERRTLTATCSQWADGSYSCTGTESHVVLIVGGETKWLTEGDLGYFDGRNMQHQRGPARDGGRTVRRATVAQLRDAATALPEAIARLLSETQAQATEQTVVADATIASL